MEERKTVFDYLEQIMVVFGFSMLIMNLSCLAFGAGAKDYSTLFALENQGVPVKISLQFLCISALITGIRFIFFTDILIRKMPLWLRTVCMLISIVILIAAFIIAFDWFPADMWQPWAMFFLCFGISFIGSCFVMLLKERTENRKMEEALRRLQEKEMNKNE